MIAMPLDGTRTTRRRVLAAGGGLSAVALTAACGAGGTETAPKTSGPVTIQYLGRGSTGEEEIYRSLINDFQGRDPNIKVDVVWAGTGGSAQIAEKLTALIAANQVPDTFWVHSAYTLDWADLKLLVDLTPYTKEK